MTYKEIAEKQKVIIEKQDSIIKNLEENITAQNRVVNALSRINKELNLICDKELTEIKKIYLEAKITNIARLYAVKNGGANV